MYKSTEVFVPLPYNLFIHNNGDQSMLLIQQKKSMLLDSFALQLFYCFAFWKFWIRNVERIFWILILGKCQRVMGLWELFLCLFLCFSSQYWIVGGRIIELIEAYYFLFYSLIFSPAFLDFFPVVIGLCHRVRLNYWVD